MQLLALRSRKKPCFDLLPGGNDRPLSVSRRASRTEPAIFFLTSKVLLITRNAEGKSGKKSIHVTEPWSETYNNQQH